MKGTWFAGLLVAGGCGALHEGIGNGTLDAEAGSVSATTSSTTDATSESDASESTTVASTGESDDDASSSSDASGSTGPAADPLCADGIVVPGELCLGPEPALPVVADPLSMAVADIDDDGSLDIVVGSDSQADISVLHGNGNGFDTPVVFMSSATRSDYVFLAALDGDPLPDLAIIDATTSILYTHLNNAGVFETASEAGITVTPTGAAAGDLGGDGLDEIAIVGQGSATVLQNLGLGLFAARQAIPVGTGPRGVALGDVDQNGWVDLVTANETGNDARVVYQNDGVFTPAVDPLAAENHPRAVALADLDGDGWLDVVLVNHGADSVSVRLGDPMVGFDDDPEIIPVEDAPAAVHVADLDGDDDLDLVVAHHAGVDNLGLHLGNGDGTFATPVIVPVGDDPISIASGDFDEDGATDLAVIGNHSDDLVVLLSDP